MDMDIGQKTKRSGMESKSMCQILDSSVLRAVAILKLTDENGVSNGCHLKNKTVCTSISRVQFGRGSKGENTGGRVPYT